MAVTKRTRFEVLRRDGHRCRYCGAAAADGARLTLDHVTPSALGGSDDPSNLVAACVDCNSGKTSTTPDAQMVAQVEDDAMRWALAVRRAAEMASADVAAATDYRNAFLDAWEDAPGWYRGPRLPDGWTSRVDAWRASGLPLDVLLDSVHIAAGANHVPREGRYAYLCGIVRNRLAKIHEQARAEMPQGKPRCGHCWTCLADGDDGDCDLTSVEPPEPGDEPRECPHCGQQDCLWMYGRTEALPEGYEAGVKDGRRQAADDWIWSAIPTLVLECFIDGRADKLPAFIKLTPAA